ncbi:MAG: CYTH domain-containing protein [Candidatus Dormibacteria bacterium]
MSDDAPVEREVKLDVDDAYVFPDLHQIPGVEVGDRGAATLEAVYWDTDDLTLARSGVGLRHRNGIWTYKGRTRLEEGSVVREEREVVAPDGAVPELLHGALTPWTPVGSLHPVVAVTTQRRTLVVRRGPQSVEAVDDLVSVRTATGELAERWRGLEVEHHADAAPLAAEVVELLVDAGARGGHTAKYLRALRALGHDVTEVVDP